MRGMGEKDRNGRQNYRNRRKEKEEGEMRGKKQNNRKKATRGK